MTTKDSTFWGRKRPTWVSGIILLNCAFLVVLSLPWFAAWDLALKRRGLDTFLEFVFPLWLFGSTLIATACFVWRRFKETRFVYNANPMTFDGIILAAWLSYLVALMLYAGALGAAG